MSAGSQIQMAPQAGLITGQQQVHNQDSNMSTGMYPFRSLIKRSSRLGKCLDEKASYYIHLKAAWESHLDTS